MTLLKVMARSLHPPQLAMSQPGQIRNPFYWLGFKLFGRMLQRRFAHQSLARMRRLVSEEMAQPQTKPVAGG